MAHCSRGLYLPYGWHNILGSFTMKRLTNIIGGLAGAVALNLLHETVKRLDPDAPRIDLVGEEGMNRLMKKAGEEPLEGNALFAATLAGDIVTNALYYSTIGAGNQKHLLRRGVTVGLSAGLGALALTRKMGFDDSPITRTNKTKLMTVGYYVFGGIVAATTIKALRKKTLSG
jgi:hypothetical protein